LAVARIAAQLQVVARRARARRRLAGSPRRFVVRPRRGSRVGQVGQLRERGLQLLLAGAGALTQLLDLLAHPLQLGELSLRILARPLGLRDALGALALLRAQPLGRGGRRSPLGVPAQNLLEHLRERRITAGEGGLDGLGLLADALEIEHAGSRPAPIFPRGLPRRSPKGRSAPCAPSTARGSWQPPWRLRRRG